MAFLTDDPRIARLQAIRSLQQQFPGRAPGGTGATGLLPNDAQGWSNVLNEQTEAANLENELGDKPALTVRNGGDLGGMKESLGDDPAWWAQAQSQGPDTTTLASIPASVVAKKPKQTLDVLDSLRKIARG